MSHEYPRDHTIGRAETGRYLVANKVRIRARYAHRRKAGTKVVLWIDRDGYAHCAPESTKAAQYIAAYEPETIVGYYTRDADLHDIADAVRCAMGEAWRVAA